MYIFYGLGENVKEATRDSLLLHTDDCCPVFILHENKSRRFFAHARRVKRTRLLKSKNVVGERVRQARIGMKPTVSQDALCGRLAREGIIITQTGISKLENGERYCMDFEAQMLAKVLKVKIAWLYGED